MVIFNSYVKLPEGNLTIQPYTYPKALKVSANKHDTSNCGATSRYLGCFCIHCGRNHKATDCRGNIACLPLLAVFFPTFPPSNYQNDPRHSCLFASRKLSWAVLCKLDLLVPTSTIKKKKKCLPNMGTICILEFWWFFSSKDIAMTWICWDLWLWPSRFGNDWGIIYAIGRAGWGTCNIGQTLAMGKVMDYGLVLW